MSFFEIEARFSLLKDHKTEAQEAQKMEQRHGSSFSSFRAYGRALVQTPHRVARRATSVTTTFEEMSRIRNRSGSDMHKSLRWFDLIGLGVGGMVGAGVFVSSGRACRYDAGPAVVLSYAIAGLCALLSAFCYTEFAVDMPVAGGAFSYLRVTFGEFAAFLTGTNLVMEYVFSNAAVARSFSAYFGTAIGISTHKWRIVVSGLPEGFNEIDFVAVAVILLISICICYRNQIRRRKKTKTRSSLEELCTGAEGLGVRGCRQGRRNGKSHRRVGGSGLQARLEKWIELQKGWGFRVADREGEMDRVAKGLGVERCRQEQRNAESCRGSGNGRKEIGTLWLCRLQRREEMDGGGTLWPFTDVGRGISPLFGVPSLLKLVNKL